MNLPKETSQRVPGKLSTLVIPHASSLLSLLETLGSITPIAELAASMMAIWAGTAIPRPISRDLVMYLVTRHVECITLMMK